MEFDNKVKLEFGSDDQDLFVGESVVGDDAVSERQLGVKPPRHKQLQAAGLDIAFVSDGLAERSSRGVEDCQVVGQRGYRLPLEDLARGQGLAGHVVDLLLALDCLAPGPGKQQLYHHSIMPSC
jgi:hypothetical protein